ncbi:glycosyltransferase [Patescibacteria group bacterium]|nr:glycosyltransferase [Patescibacteria group bacterium]MBU1931647.1 glycosyltransferase [Patescibacteria group bacterium]
MKVALVYDRVTKWGGVERVLLALHQLWPEAPLFTAVYRPQTASWAEVFQIKTSFLQHWPLAKSHHEFYPWLTPLAFESFNFDKYDVVISVTSAEAKAIITKPATLHICYCLTPTRYLWSHQKRYFKRPGLAGFSQLGRQVFKLLSPPMRSWDKLAAQRPDVYLAISKVVQQRIKKYYHRNSRVIYPGIDSKQFSTKRYSLNVKPYFLIVSRLVPYKNIDLAIKTCNQLKTNLKIIGVGREEKYLKGLAGPTIQFLGQLGEQELIAYYQNCQALIIPGEEDFGLVALEAQAAGKPVIALAAGGAKETIISEQTGLFFSRPKTVDLVQALIRFDKMAPNKFKLACQQNAQRFALTIFKTKFKNKVEELWQQHQTF